jgi:asparagine synthase (glutamine-hydrolysing)
MCGLAGVYERAGDTADRSLLLAMAGELRHRGPDGTGLYVDGRLGMINNRLAIVDLAGGDQPLSDERGRFWAMQNGEIYNHVELRAELERLGREFATTSDTEVIAHAYAQWGVDCLRHFNGDFAIAVWDRERRELFLARDRFGVRPLFLAEYGGDVCFASEAKALLRHPRSRRELDPVAIADTFTMWTPLPDRSAFAGIRELPPAHYVLVGPDGPGPLTRWWDLEFNPDDATSEEELIEQVEALLVDAIRIRLRADVPVATYLSGGLDSSAMAAIAARQLQDDTLFAFGVGFADERYDESAEQDAIARELGTAFQRTVVDAAAIADVFPRAIELAEKPLLRTAPAPLLRLSGAVRDAGLKVVLTGEAADELFGGYDIFREDRVRRFWARDPSSQLRPLLLRRLNRWLATDPARAGAFLTRFYARDLEDVDDPLYSHRLRFANTGRCLRLLSPAVLESAAREGDAAGRLIRSLPPQFDRFSPLARAQYLETVTFFQGYLLHSQGDRMLMGHSIEGRFPFVDFRLAELAARLPDSLRLRGLKEKYALRRAVAPYLDDSIRSRPKVPYRAPIREVFFGARRPDYVGELLRADHVEETGLFDPAAVARVTAKFEAAQDGGVSETDEMALVGAVSLLLLHERMVRAPTLAPPLEATRVVVGRDVVADAWAEPVAEAI